MTKKWVCAVCGRDFETKKKLLQHYYMEIENLLNMTMLEEELGV